MNRCAEIECAQTATARGLCDRHYVRAKKENRLPPAKGHHHKSFQACTVAGCARGVCARGMCASHYSVARRRGDFRPNRRNWHSLSNIDGEVRTATCAVCGPQTRVHRTTRGWCCAIKQREHDPSYHRKHRPVGPFCEICGVTEPVLQMNREHRRGTTLCWDHDHATGKHRGTLCQRCNKLLGSVGDSTALLNAAISYLQKAKQRTA